MQMLPLPLPCNNFVSWAKHFLLPCCFFWVFLFSFFILFCYCCCCFSLLLAEHVWKFPMSSSSIASARDASTFLWTRALLQQSRAFMPLAFWKLDRITIILLDLKVTFRKWVEWVRKCRQCEQKTEDSKTIEHRGDTNKQTNKPLGFSRESDQIWHFHCCFVFSEALMSFSEKEASSSTRITIHKHTQTMLFLLLYFLIRVFLYSPINFQNCVFILQRLLRFLSLPSARKWVIMQNVCVLLLVVLIVLSVPS